MLTDENSALRMEILTLRDVNAALVLQIDELNRDLDKSHAANSKLLAMKAGLDADVLKLTEDCKANAEFATQQLDRARVAERLYDDLRKKAQALIDAMGCSWQGKDYAEYAVTDDAKRKPFSDLEDHLKQTEKRICACGGEVKRETKYLEGRTVKPGEDPNDVLAKFMADSQPLICQKCGKDQG